MPLRMAHDGGSPSLQSPSLSVRVSKYFDLMISSNESRQRYRLAGVTMLAWMVFCQGLRAFTLSAAFPLLPLAMNFGIMYSMLDPDPRLALEEGRRRLIDE